MERTDPTGLLDLEPAVALAAKTTFAVPKVHCWTCAATLEEVLRTLPGVRRVVVHLMTARVEISFDPSITSSDELREGILNGGFLAPAEHG